MSEQCWYNEDEWLEFTMSAFLSGATDSNVQGDGGGWFDDD